MSYCTVTSIYVSYCAHVRKCHPILRRVSTWYTISFMQLPHEQGELKETVRSYYKDVFSFIRSSEADALVDLWFGKFADDGPDGKCEQNIGETIDDLDQFFSASGLDDAELLAVVSQVLPKNTTHEISTGKQSAGRALFHELWMRLPIEDRDEGSLDSGELTLTFPDGLSLSLSMHGDMWRQPLNGVDSFHQPIEDSEPTRVFSEFELSGRLEKQHPTEYSQ